MSQFVCGDNVQTHSNTLNNLVHGVGERVLFTDGQGSVPTKPVVEIFEERLHLYRDFIARRVGHQSPVTRQDFASFYKGPRLLTYQRAVNGLAIIPVRRADATLKTFIKAEKHNLTLKPNTVPRVIQPRDPRYNVEVGRYLRPIEKMIYHTIDELFKSPTIMSEYNSYTQAQKLHSKWIGFKEPACVGMDASRFDQHVSAQALQFEHTIYNRVFRSKELAMLLGWQIDNHGIARASDGSFRYKKRGSRMSGDMNTSMGNKLLMCMMAKSYLDTLSIRVDFANNGDDCLLFLERKHIWHLDGLPQYFKEFGFKIVTEKPVFEFEQVEFCQTKPVLSNGIWRMVRNVRTCITKDVTSVNLGHDTTEYRRWLRDIGNCGLTTCADVPVLGEFYRMLVRFGLDGNYGGSFDTDYRWYKLASRNATCLHSRPDDYGRYSFWLSTGMTPDAQLELESYYSNSVWGGDKRQFIKAYTYLLKL